MSRKNIVRFFFLSVVAAASVSFAAAPAAKASCAGKCHIIKPYEAGVNDGNNLVSAHAAAGLVCSDCHDRDAETVKQENSVYKSGKYEDPLSEREYDADFCLRCHESYEAVAKRSAGLKEKLGRNPHESHLGEIDCSQCHKMHRRSKFICSECHKSDYGKLLPKWDTIKVQN